MNREKILENIREYISKNKLNDLETAKLLSDIRIDIMYERCKDRDGIFVLKNMGTLEEYDKEKIFNSLASASDYAGEKMTSADINIIIRTLERKIEESGRNLVTTLDLRTWITNELNNSGFKKIEEQYNK